MTAVRAPWVALLLVMAAIASGRACAAELPAPYAPSQQVSGTLTIWGHGSYGAHTDFVEGLTRAWEEGFRKHQPGIVFSNRLHGTASAIGALYTGSGDLALMGREIWDPEIEAFNEVKGYPPTGVEVMTGSFDVRNKGYAVVFFVHRDNPLQSLSLKQLDAIFSAGRRRGGDPVVVWGDVGLTDAWASRPVRPYGLPIARGFADFVQESVFESAQIWNPALKEFADEPGSRGGATDGGQKMLDAMALDPESIGYAGLLYTNPQVKPIALSRGPDTPAVEATQATVADRSYPLARTISMFIDRAPGKAVDPNIAEFLRYILSREGQQAVAEHGHGYLPLPAALAAREARTLD